MINRRDKRISNVDLAGGTGVVRDLVTDATRGDFVAVGPDGCLYATQSSEVVRLVGVDGDCSSIGIALEPTGVRIAPPDASYVQISGGSVRAATCRTNRRLKVRFRAPGGIRVRTARIFVKGKFNRRVSGRALRRNVTVKKLPAKRFTLTIRARTTKGRNIVVRRRYGACAGASRRASCRRARCSETDELTPLKRRVPAADQPTRRRAPRARAWRPARSTAWRRSVMRLARLTGRAVPVADVRDRVAARDPGAQGQHLLAELVGALDELQRGVDERHRPRGRRASRRRRSSSPGAPAAPRSAWPSRSAAARRRGRRRGRPARPCA